MADEIDETIVDASTEGENHEGADNDAHLHTEIDYKALADAERARADAAEALIIKNKAIAKRNQPDSDDKPLTKADVQDIVSSTFAELKEKSELTPEEKELETAKERIRQLEAQNEEKARALKAKAAKTATATSQRDGDAPVAPKLPANSPLRSYTYVGKGIYSKKLANGKTIYRNTKATGIQQKTWVV